MNFLPPISMMHTMNSTGLDMGFATLWGIHILAVFAFLIGSALFIGWAIKTLPAAQLRSYALWLLVGGAVVCILTIGAKGSTWSADGMRGGTGMKMMNMQKAGGGMMGGMMDNDEDDAAMDMSMKDMADMLKGKTGDDLDSAFLEGMIPHHQGAIDMANMILNDAKHPELRKMAQDIITAQQSEINMMEQWQKNWGYTQ
jgi:hypothetical protein